MKILALVGSPRKGSNTDTLVEEMLKGSKVGGHKYEKIYLYEYEISPCIEKCIRFRNFSLKALFLGAVFLIDFVHFENKGKN